MITRRKYGQLASAARNDHRLYASAEEPVMVQKIVLWAIVIFAVWFLFTNPDGAAALGSHILNGLKSAGAALSTFISHL